MTRFLLFLISYGLMVVTITQMIFYLNYRSVGYSWNEVFSYILQTPDFKLFVISSICFTCVVFFPSPSRLPSL